MAKNRRRVYEEIDERDRHKAKSCPTCGCRHRETVDRFAVGRSFCVKSVCRNCGREFVDVER